MSSAFLFTGRDDAAVTLLLAHGSGAPMDSAAMNGAAEALAAEGLRVARFEFAYMAARRTEGSRRPPPRAETLNPEFRAAVTDLAAKGPLVIGGKSMGGRVASMVADGLFAEGRIAGLLCLGYPFHPPEKPAQLRTAHLMTLTTPILICQGTRDPFGTKDEVPGYGLPERIRFLWLEDGDHDLKPRKSVSGFTAADHLSTMARTVKAWAADLG
ncbi:alpha/beta family hydrolase [Shinella sp. HZN7]|uniref:alpha/beta hydrolase family protein n=1 Tax=Shinella sp. (strain HZN7) TaxID=879274 RepID=UPI0007DAB258|nr:alpha/beta family hydrolase [Shinella sp. HZN7]ANH03935.1 alpha/beta hydrolase [Shinella sp. HZN7]